MSSIDELSTDNDSNDGSVSAKYIKEILWRSQIHPELNSRDTIFKIRNSIRKTQNYWKVTELSAKSTGKGFHKLFKAVVN